MVRFTYFISHLLWITVPLKWENGGTGSAPEVAPIFTQGATGARNKVATVQSIYGELSADAGCFCLCTYTDMTSTSVVANCP